MKRSPGLSSQDEAPATSTFVAERSRLGAICLLLAAGAALWTVSVRLGSGRDDDRRIHPNPPTHGDDRTARTYPVPPPLEKVLSATRLSNCRVLDPLGRPLGGAIVHTGDFEVCTGPNGCFALGSEVRSIRISRDGFFPLVIDNLELRRRRFPGSTGKPDASDAPGGETPGGNDDEAGDDHGDSRTSPRPTIDFVLVPGARLVGRIVGPTAAPVEGARVTVGRDRFRPLSSVRSDGDGRWSSPLLHPGTVVVIVSHRDFRVREESVPLHAPGTSSRCDLQLETGQAMTVRVETPAGRPLADADVWIDLASRTTASTRHYLGRSDDVGKLHCHRARGRHGRVRARLAGYRETSRSLADVERLDGREVVTLSLPDAPHLRAHTVRADNGLPVTPRDVGLETLIDGTFRAAPHRGLLFHSLSDGKVRAGLPPRPGTYRLVAHAAGGLFGTSGNIAFDGVESPDPFVVRLAHTPRMSGRILAGGRPVAGALVEVVAANTEELARPRLHGIAVPPEPGVLSSTHTDLAGRFSFSGVSVDSCRLAVRHADFAEHLTPPLMLPLPDESELPIRLTKGAVLRGRLLCADGAEPGALPVVLTSRSCRPRSTLTDESGRFEFGALPAAQDYKVTAGRAEVGAYAHTMAPGSVGPLSVPPGGEVDCELRTTLSPAGSLAGQVTLDGTAIECVVRIQPAHSPLSLVELHTDEDGRFFVRPLPPGSYRITGVEMPFERTARVRAGERNETRLDIETLSWEVEIISSETGTRVLTPCSVRIAPVNANTGSAAKTVAINAGRGEIARLWPGAYDVRVEAPGFVSTNRRIDLSRSSAHRIALEPGKSLRLRLVTENGKVFRGQAEVTVLRGEKTILRHTRQVEETLTLEPLPRGVYSVVVKVDEGEELRYRLTID